MTRECSETPANQWCPNPQTGALTELRYAPTLELKAYQPTPTSTNQEMVTALADHFVMVSFHERAAV